MRTIVTCMKNEGPFILEWVAYHLLIGFDKFVIYTNDCNDFTDDIAKRLSDMGFGLHIENPRIGSQRPQAVAMRDMFQHDLVHNADWVFFADCDEFLNIKVGDGYLDDLISYSDEVECISVMWRLFGDSGICDFSDRPITGDFLHAAPLQRSVSTNAWGFKSLFRPTDNISRIGAHRPFFSDVDSVRGRWITSNGEPIDDRIIKSGWRFTHGNGGYKIAQLNHYAIRSIDSFLVKCERGHVLHTQKQIDFNYYLSMNHNLERDNSMLRWTDSLAEKLQYLKSDVIINDLHTKSVNKHEQIAKNLRVKYSDLYRELCESSLTGGISE